MARRERTTGLPAPRRRARAVEGRRFAGVHWTQSHLRWAILVAAAAVLFVVVGFIAYRWYDANIATPNRTVLQVGNDKISLRYYTQRMYQYMLDAKPQNASDLLTDQQQLLTQLQTEALTVQLAEQKGIKLTANDITAEIASELGVPVGGPGSSFDTLYRQKLKDSKMSDSSYRRMAEATLANKKLLAYYTKLAPTKGELVTIRAVVLSTQADATKALDAVKGGQDLGTYAQKNSTDLTSKQNDGLMAPSPPQILPGAVQTAIKGKAAGNEVYGPVQVSSDWWVFQVARIDQNSPYDANQEQQIGQQNLTQALNEAANTTKIVRNLTTSDINWANNNANK